MGKGVFMRPEDKGRITRILNKNRLNVVFDLAKLSPSKRASYFYGPKDQFEAAFVLKYLPMLVAKAIPVLKIYDLHQPSHWDLLMKDNYPEVKELKEKIKEFKEMWNVRPKYR